MRFSKLGLSILNLSACLMAVFLLFAAVGARAQTPAKKTAFEKPVVRTIKGNGKKKTGKTIQSKNIALPDGEASMKAEPTTPSKDTQKTQVKKKVVLQNQPANAMLAAPPSGAKIWTVMSSLSRSSSLYDHQDGTRRDSGDVFARLGLRVTENWGLSAAVSHSSDLNNDEYTGFGDLSLGASRRPVTMGSALVWVPAIALVVPTSKHSQVYQNLLFATGGTISMSVRPELLKENLSVGFGVGVTRLVHQYEENSLGGINTEWSSRQFASVGYTFGRFSISAQLMHRNSLSYQGTMRESFDHTEDLSYQASDNLSLSVGHSLSGSVFRPNGQDSNLAFVNENDSTVYGSLTVFY